VPAVPQLLIPCTGASVLGALTGMAFAPVLCPLHRRCRWMCGLGVPRGSTLGHATVTSLGTLIGFTMKTITREKLRNMIVGNHHLTTLEVLGPELYKKNSPARSHRCTVQRELRRGDPACRARKGGAGRRVLL
jgi:hypothetical protein